ncbi:MAG: MarR family transcriptional regulator [Anaerolineae bacterium]|nr:MarR family transcriptional regulator [Anaerolineae bacterium]
MAHNTPSQDLTIVDSLVQLSFLIQAVLLRIGTAHDVSIIQIRLLGVLRDREPGMMELAKFLNLDKSSVTGLVDRAERRGLVQRTTTPEDGRAIRVSVTANGRELIAEVTAEIEGEIHTLVAGLSDDERKQMTAIASRIFAAQ